MIRVLAIALIGSFLVYSCSSESKKEEETKKSTSEKADLSNFLGVWALRSQAFEKGAELSGSSDLSIIKLVLN